MKPISKYPEQFRRVNGVYFGKAAVGRRSFPNFVGEREFTIIAPDPETVKLLWERLMHIEIDDTKIQNVKMSKPTDNELDEVSK